MLDSEGFDIHDRYALRDLLWDYFTLDEILNLAFYELGLGTDDLKRDTKANLIRALIEYCGNRMPLERGVPSPMGCLLLAILRVRPREIINPRLLNKSPVCIAEKVVIEVVVKENAAIPTELLADLENLTKKYPGKIGYLGMRPGSTRILINLEKEGAKHLLTSKIASLADGKYEVISIKRIEDLKPAEREVWRNQVWGNSPQRNNQISRKVLVVDDDLRWQKRIKTLVNSMDYEVVLADSAEAALNAANAEPQDFALITLDLHLESDSDESQGLALYQELRREGVKSPFVLLSAYLTPEAIVETFNDSDSIVKAVGKDALTDIGAIANLTNLLRNTINGA
jgi:CheY-like chemotaxis protein